VEIKTQLRQRDFMMVRAVRPNGEQQATVIHNRHDCHAFSAFSLANSIAAAIGRGERGVDKTFLFVHCAGITQHVRQLGQYVIVSFVERIMPTATGAVAWRPRRAPIRVIAICILLN
jgi:hypothetical protein